MGLSSNRPKYGPELVSNGTFPNTDGWLGGLSTNIAAVDGRLQLTGSFVATKYPKAGTSVGTLDPAKTYRVFLEEGTKVHSNNVRLGLARTSGSTAWTLDDLSPTGLPGGVQFLNSSVSIADFETTYTPGEKAEHTLFLYGQDYNGSDLEMYFDNISLKEIL